MDDVFLQRRFYSTIVKESNPEGLRIKDYKTEVADQQNEANRIEKKLINLKRDRGIIPCYSKASFQKQTASPPKPKQQKR